MKGRCALCVRRADNKRGRVVHSSTPIINAHAEARGKGFIQGSFGRADTCALGLRLGCGQAFNGRSVNTVFLCRRCRR